MSSMRILKRSPLLVLFLAGLVAWTAAPAQGAFVLKVDDPSTPGVDFTVVDDGALDLKPTQQGLMLYSGSVGSFSVVVTTAMSKPTIGSTERALLDMVSVLVSGGAGTLQFGLTDTDYQLSTQQPGRQHILYSNVDGSTAGSVEFQSFLDVDNGEFGLGLTPGLQGAFGSGAFIDSQQLGFAFADGRPFSLTQVAKITHTAAGQTTNFHVRSDVHTPEPASLAVWSMLGLVVGGLARRRKRAV